MEKQVQKKLEEFFSQFKPLTYKKGQIIIRPEDPIFGIYLLKKGYIRQYVISENGDEISINIFRPISFIPMMLAIGNTENRYYFETASEVAVWRAPTNKTLEFVKNEPAVLFDLAQRFAAGLNGISQRLENLMFENAYKRIISLLLYLTKRFGKEDEAGILIDLPLSHKDIATWVNLSRETTSRQLEKLVKVELISFNHQFITVKKPDQLQKLM